MYYITHDGKLRCLDPNTVIHINSSGALIGGTELPWMAGGRFKKITGFYSSFLVEDVKLYVKNFLKELASEDEGRVFGGAPGYSCVVESCHNFYHHRWTPATHHQTSDLFQATMMTLMCALRSLQANGFPNVHSVVFEEAISGRTEAIVEEEKKNADRYWLISRQPFGIFHYEWDDIHYTEFKPVSIWNEFFNTTFVFDGSGFQIYLGNVATKPLTEMQLQPLRVETWGQEVLHNKWIYRDTFVAWFFSDLETDYVSIHRRIQNIIYKPGPVDKKTHDWDEHTLAILYDISSNIMIYGIAYSDIEDERARAMGLEPYGI
jgi:hypothetical protein